MSSTLTTPSSAWRRRVRELLSFLVRSAPPDRRRPMAWADMQPIDFEGEDGSLTERDLRLLK